MPSMRDSVSVDGATMKLYLSVPDGAGPFPAVVVIQHQGGVDEFVEEMTDRVGAAGCLGVVQSRIRVCSAGTMMSSRIGPMSMPPTTTVASGRWTWLPIPVEIAAGSRPMQADSAIIMIGRICCPTASNIASIVLMPLEKIRL